MYSSLNLQLLSYLNQQCFKNLLNIRKKSTQDREVKLRKKTQI